MERLTGPKWSNRHYHIYATVYPKRKDMEPAFQKIVDRLGRYEDTGLEPEEILHWISVSERLPKKSGHYLVISKMNWAHGGNWEDDSGDIRRHMAIAFFDRVVKFNVPYVTHWQPLPAVPKEEK